MIDEIIYKLKLIFIPCEENKYRPKFLESKFLYYYAALLLVLKFIIIPFFIYLPKTNFFADLTRTALINCVNRERESLGLTILSENSKLIDAAYLKAKDIIEKDYFAHYSPEGISPWHWFILAGYNYNFAGENLAIGFLDSEEVHQAWLNSPSHKENILNPNYSEIGIAVLKGDFQGKETTVVVQLFGKPQIRVAEAKAAKVEEISTPKEITQEEKIATETTPVASETPIPPREVLSTFKEINNKKTLAFGLFSFLSSGYYDLLQKIIYGSLVFIVISLILTVLCDIFIYHAYEIQYKDMVFKTIYFGVFLLILLSIDKGTIIQLIPHNFISSQIYF